MRRFPVDGGDFVPAITSDGTYILIRHETEPYLVVPPVVAEAWSLAITRSGGFLWPVSTRKNGTEIYEFYTNTVPSRIAYSFAYQSPNNVEPELSEEELQADANLAR
jgi:hypothetical protein